MKKKSRSYFRDTIQYFRILKWAILMQIKGAGVWYIFYLLKTFFSQISTIISSFILSLILNSLTTGFQSHFSEEIKNQIYLYIGYFFLFQAVEQFINAISPYVDHLIRYKTRIEFKKTLLQKIIDLDWTNIENPIAEQQIRTSFSDSTYSIVYFLVFQVQAVILILSFFFTVLLAKFPTQVILITLITALPQALVNIKSSRENEKAYQKSQPFFTKSEGILNFFRSFSTLFEIKTSHIAPILKEKHIQLSTQADKNSAEVTKKFIKWDFIVSLFTIFVNLAFFLYYLEQVISGTINIGTFQFIFISLYSLRGYISSFFSQSTGARNEYQYLKYSFNFLNTTSRIQSEGIEFDGNFRSLEFKNVWFRYPKSKKWALENISTIIRNKERIALVGENGAGKSTFVKILLRAYEITKGEILLNGIPIQRYSLDSLYRNLAIITQDFSRFDVMTVRENISIGNPEALEDFDKVKEAAHLAEADTFINHLKHKYDTVLSKRIDGGTELSSGQWQKIALARLFFADKPMVLLDEPTASIDPVSEHRIFQNIYQKLKNKTVILVSHRYNTVREANNILVFKDGQIIEQGTHKELLAKKGYYAEAYSLQGEGKVL